MKDYIKEIFKLKNNQLNSLLMTMTEKEIMEQRRHFKLSDTKIMQPITIWRLLYYVDKYGDFVNTGGLKHHKIARAIYNSMCSKRKIEILHYIEDVSKLEK